MPLPQKLAWLPPFHSDFCSTPQRSLPWWPMARTVWYLPVSSLNSRWYNAWVLTGPQNTASVSQSPWQVGVAMWLHAGQWIGRQRVWATSRRFLKGRHVLLLLTPFLLQPAVWMRWRAAMRALEEGAEPWCGRRLGAWLTLRSRAMKPALVMSEREEALPLFKPLICWTMRMCR